MWPRQERKWGSEKQKSQWGREGCLVRKDSSTLNILISRWYLKFSKAPQSSRTNRELLSTPAPSPEASVHPRISCTVSFTNCCSSNTPLSLPSQYVCTHCSLCLENSPSLRSLGQFLSSLLNSVHTSPLLSWLSGRFHSALVPFRSCSLWVDAVQWMEGHGTWWANGTGYGWKCGLSPGVRSRATGPAGWISAPHPPPAHGLAP